MRSPTVEVSLYLRIHDEEEFRQAAYERALQDGLSEDEALRYKDLEDMSLGDCARMLVDPGTGPAGCEVLDSSAEVA